MVEPFFNGQQPLTPSTELTSEVVRHVYGQTYWTAPSPHSPLSAFAFDEEEQEPPGFYLRGVEWRLLPQLDELERREWLRALDNRLEQLRYADGVEDLERALWRSIVKHEAIEYYALKRAEVGYELDVIGERTNRVFDLLSERLSLAQIYHVIFVSVRNTHHHITKERIPKYRGKNFFLGAIERNADRYAAEGWLKEYRRDFNCPQSTLSSVFFDGYLQIGGSYFTQVAPAVSGDLS